MMILREDFRDSPPLADQDGNAVDQGPRLVWSRLIECKAFFPIIVTGQNNFHPRRGTELLNALYGQLAKRRACRPAEKLAEDPLCGKQRPSLGMQLTAQLNYLLMP